MILTVFFSIVGGINKTFAADNNSSAKGNFFSVLFEKIASILGLDKTKVQEAANQAKTEMKLSGTPPTIKEGGTNPNRPENLDPTKMMEERLALAVKNGKITEAQRTAIITEVTAVMKKYTLDNSATLEERKTAMEKQQTELKEWAKSQGIDEQYVVFGFGNGGEKGQGKAPNDNNREGNRQQGKPPQESN